jgi:hypothetical protein
MKNFWEKSFNLLPAQVRKKSLFIFIHSLGKNRESFLLQNPLQSYPKNPLLCSTDPELIVSAHL